VRVAVFASEEIVGEPLEDRRVSLVVAVGDRRDGVTVIRVPLIDQGVAVHRCESVA
jgi:hypothetical protein